MSQYELLKELDLITPVSNAIRAEKILIDKTRSKLVYKTTKESEMPWVLIRKDPSRDCNRWLGIYFNYYRIIPSKCFGCMKIVFRPNNLEECFAVEEVQQDMGMYSKYGMEQREFCPHLYGAFWYVPMGANLARAQQLHGEVKKALETKLNREVKLILKRACTEMELGYGDSTTWGDFPPQDQVRYEHLLDSTYEAYDEKQAQQTPMEQATIRRRMIEYAWKNGDETYKLFTNSKPLFPASHDYSNDSPLEGL